MGAIDLTPLSLPLPPNLTASYYYYYRVVYHSLILSANNLNYGITLYHVFHVLCKTKSSFIVSVSFIY